MDVARPKLQDDPLLPVLESKPDYPAALSRLAQRLLGQLALVPGDWTCE